MSFCTQCGATLDSADRFCRECGEERLRTEPTGEEVRGQSSTVELADVENVREFSPADGARLEHQVREKLVDWRALLRGAPQEARQVLRVLLTDRLTFEPTKQDGRRLYRYRGTFTVGALFAGDMCPQMLASPTGFALMWTPKLQGKALIAA